MRKKKAAVILGLVLLCFSLNGCQKEPTKEEIEASQYYIDLQNQYTKLEKKNKKLNEKLVAASEKSPEETEIENLLDKIGRDSLIKMEVAYGDTSSGSVFTDHKGVLTLANKLAESATLVTRFTVDDIVLNHGNTYNYVLYDEDNSVFELMVFDGDYVIFKDLPEKVFHCYGANSFGQAYLARRNFYPKESLYLKMIESQIAVNGEKAYRNNIVYRVVSYLNTMDKKSIKEKKVKDKIKTTYIFYNHADTITLGLGKKTIHIVGMDKDLWYTVNSADIKKIKEIFKGV